MGEPPLTAHELGHHRHAYLGLGSNVGDRRAALRAARAALAQPGVRVTASSSAYETAPQGEVLDQADFLNACLALDVAADVTPDALLDLCKAVERRLGRLPAAVRHAPRPIDVDLLLLGDLVYGSERLTLPHPGVTTRRFVVEPLLELDPGLRLPDGTALAGVLGSLLDQRVTRVGPL